MRSRCLTSVTVGVALFVIAASADVLGAQQAPSLSASPDHILRGTAPAITITLDTSVRTIKSVQVAGIDLTPVPKPNAEGKVLVQLPNLDFVGRAAVAVIGNDGKPLALGELTYVELGEPRSVPVLGSNGGLFLLIVYVALIVLLPIWATMYDMKKSYAERDGLKGTTTAGGAAGSLTDAEGPTGFVGLTRGLIALTLILTLAIAVFHLIVFPPEVKIPDVAEKLLVLLAGTLTAITGFYFGSKTATEAAEAARRSSNGDQTKDSGKPTISDVMPSPDKKELTVTGKGFGQRNGQISLKIDGTDVPVSATNMPWADTIIKVSLANPVGGDVRIVVTNDRGQRSDEFSKNFS